MAKILTVPVLELRSGLQRDTSGFSWRGVPGSRPDSCRDPGLPSTQEAGIPGKRVQGSEHPLCLPPENPHAEPHLGKVPITQRDDRDTRGHLRLCHTFGNKAGKAEMISLLEAGFSWRFSGC